MVRPPTPKPNRASLAALAWAAALALGAGGGPALPPIVFVSRQAPPAGGEIPGFGPRGRAEIVGGRLLVREPDGRIRSLLDDGAFFDVSHPSVAPDGRRVAFAAVKAAGDPWRLWVVAVDGGALAAVPVAAPGLDSAGAGGDDLQPCWADDTTLVFTSTRGAGRSTYGDVPNTNLYAVPAAGGAVRRLTSERNGAEAPSVAGPGGDLLFARWWFNPWRASDRAARGITRDASLALPGDSVNLWQPMRLSGGAAPRLAAGDARVRLRSMGYQPIALPGGAVAAVYARNLGLFPRAGATGIWVFDTPFATPRRLAGAAVAESPADPYAAATGLAAPSACAPAALPDGRVVFAYDPGARGDFGLWVAGRDGRGLTRLVDLPGTLELDPAPVVVRRAPRSTRAPAWLRPGLADEAPFGRAPKGSFTFHDVDVFGGAGAAGGRGDAPRRTTGARLRFFALADSGAVGTAEPSLIREVAVGARGEVLERGLPADFPLFEQLVDGQGHPLMSAHGAAHVRGFNAGRPGIETRCIGCHVGHSTLPVP